MGMFMNGYVSKTLAVVALSLLLLGLPACSHRQAEDVDDGIGAGNVAAEDSAANEATADGETPDGSEDFVAVTDPPHIEPRELTMSATEENVRFIGRTCMTDDVTWLPQSGSAVEFVVTGTRVELEIVSDNEEEYDENFCPRFAVLVDGEVVLDETVGLTPCLVEAFNSESSMSAVVEVIHLSEANMGAIGVKAITVESSAATPVMPSVPKNLSIEFIGDSITCGYGVEANAIEDPFMTTTENFMKTYAYLTAQALNADYSAVCYSGYGVVSGYSDGFERNEEALINMPLYEVVSKEIDQPWDFSVHAYDVVVINLGTNDYTYTYLDEGRMQEFSLGYADFLAQVRAHNPGSYIICTMGTMGCQELYPYIEQAVERFKSTTGDERVMCYPSDPIDMEADGTGAGGHPNAISNQKSADKLVDVIRQVLDLRV